MFAICTFLILSSLVNLVKLELETFNQSSFNKSSELNYETNGELNQQTANTISQFTFDDKNLDYSLLNRYILENNNIYLPDNQVNQQDAQQDGQQANDHRSKVYMFKPKQISETTTLESDQGLRHLSHLSLPTKSTLSKSFPKLYKQLYQLEKSPLQQNLNQFFRSSMDDLSANQRLNDPFKQINPNRIEVFTKNLQILPLAKKFADDRNKISSNMVRFQSVDTFAENRTETTLNSADDDERYSAKTKNSIESESSNKNESLIKNEAKNQTSIKVDDLSENQKTHKLNQIKKGKKLTYKDLRALSPLEFKGVKLDKAKFNSKRYVPKIVYSKMKSKKSTNTNQGSNVNQDSNNQLKIVPISYVPVDDNLLLNQIIDNTVLSNQNAINFGTANTPDLYSLGNLGLVYNLNSLDLIGTLIDNLISNLPGNLLNSYSNDLPHSSLDLNGLLIANNNVNKRLDLRNKKMNKKKKEELRMKEKSNRAKSVLNVLEIKELIEQLGGAGFNDAVLEKMKSNSKSDITIQKNSKGKNDKKAELHAKWLKWLNNLTRMDLKKLENLNRDIRQSSYVLKNEEKFGFTKPNCMEFKNSTVCFTGIDN